MSPALIIRRIDIGPASLSLQMSSSASSWLTSTFFRLDLFGDFGDFGDFNGIDLLFFFFFDFVLKLEESFKSSCLLCESPSVAGNEPFRAGVFGVLSAPPRSFVDFDFFFFTDGVVGTALSPSKSGASGFAFSDFDFFFFFVDLVAISV